jgi:hypothetical protein
MIRYERSAQLISLDALVALSDEVTATPAASRERHPARRRRTLERDTWARMSLLERSLAADRDDPSFDYAAN